MFVLFAKGGRGSDQWKSYAPLTLFIEFRFLIDSIDDGNNLLFVYLESN
jgi:hypothetical protein